MKSLIRVAFTLFLFFLFSQPVKATENHVSASAQLSVDSNHTGKKADTISEHTKRIAMTRVLKRYNSPLVNHVDGFIKTSTEHELDDYFLLSIAGVESGFARVMIPGTHNPFGYGKGTIVFENWEDGIETVGSKLRTRYINKGATNLDQIGHIYAGGSTTWAGKVRFFMNEFKKEEDSMRLMNYYL